jgi:HK97 family phage portal protein
MSIRSLFGGIVRAEAPVPFTSRYRTALPGFNLGTESMDRRAELAQYEAVGTLFGVVSKLATTTALVNWRLYRSSASGLDEDRVEVITGKHAASKVWARPNEFFGRTEFVETVQQHIDLTGEGWWVIVRVGVLPVEIWPVRPDRMQPVTSIQDFIAGYIYTSPDGEQIPLRREDVIMIRWPAPLDIYRGTSPLPALSTDIANERAQSTWNASFYRNSANPGGIIKVDRQLQDEDFDELVERWNSQHRGVSNAGRVAILEEADFVPLSYTQRDMQFVESRGLTKQAILDAYGFPKFGLGDVDDVNRATADASLAMFAQQLTIPRLERWKDALNLEFLPLFGATAAGLEFDYDNPVPEDRETENATLTAKVNAVVELIRAGADPVQACDAVGLPQIDFDMERLAPVRVPSTTGQPELEPA